MATAITAVDCRSTLPCASLTPDEAWRIELVSTGMPALDATAGLRIDFEIEALTRDAQLGVSTASSVSADGRSAMASDIDFGPAPIAGDVARHELRPGDPVAGHATFEPLVENNSPSSPVRLILVLEEAGTRSDMAFENVPRSGIPVAGTAEGAAGGVDCAGTLPCAWASDDGALAIDIDAIGLVYWHHSTRLIVDWSASASSPLGLRLADAARAVTDEGKELEYYGIDFGGTTSRGEGALSADSGPTLPVSGRIVFRRAPPATATSLASVSFELTSIAATAPVRRRVELRNVPFER